MTVPMPDFGRTPTGPIHEPVRDAREPRTRHPLMFWDRAKILIFLAAYLALSVAVKHGAVPIMSWGDALREEVRAKSIVFVLAAIEALRQLHFLISERSAAYHQFWEKHVWQAWDRRMGKLNPWLRYRLGRLVRVLAWGSLVVLLFSALWHVSFLEALVEAPGRLWNNPFGNGQMPWFFSIFYLLLISVGQFVAIFWFLSKGGVDTYMPQDIKTRFSDVWGQDKVLEKVKENILLLDKPQEIEGRGGHVPGGILLWGPPGTGKTLMAEAVAGETGRPYVFVDPGAFINMFFGVGVLKVKGLFRRLRKLALRYGGVIVFFDEADSLGNRGGGGVASRVKPSLGEIRSVAASQLCNGLHYVSSRTAMSAVDQELARMAHQAVADTPRESFVHRIVMGGLNGGGGGMGTLQALLTEMSGLSKPRGFVSRRLRAFLCMRPKQPPKYRILVMMATNLPDALDQALLRPGRIDRIYKVDFPTLEGRVKTFEGYFNKVRHDLTPEQIERLATMSPRASGAVIKDIVNESLIIAIRDGRDTITWPDVLEARAFKVHGLADGVAPTELEQHESAIHEAAHAVACYLLRRREVIDIATIEQRGDVGGFVSPVAIEERKFSWRDEMELDVICSLASLAGERMFFGGDSSEGVFGDLRNSTGLVRIMLSRIGMGPTITSHVPDPAFAGLGGPADDLSQARRNEFDAAVEAKLQELYQRTEKLLDDNRWFLISIAHALQAHRTITGEDIDAIYNGTQGPTLDGAYYHTEGFRRDIIEFLTAAREAHLSQGQLTHPLPRAEKPVLVGATVAATSTEVGHNGQPQSPAVASAPQGPPAGWPTAPPSGPPTWGQRGPDLS